MSLRVFHGTTVTAILKAMTFTLQLLEVLAIDLFMYGMAVGTLCCTPTVPPDR